jgi:hypothetical protein
MAAELGIETDPAKYYYLNQGAAEKVRGMNDKQWWQEMEAGMKGVGFTNEERLNVFRALGTLQFLKCVLRLTSLTCVRGYPTVGRVQVCTRGLGWLDACVCACCAFDTVRCVAGRTASGPHAQHCDRQQTANGVGPDAGTGPRRARHACQGRLPAVVWLGL